jgi:hypothetical protein
MAGFRATTGGVTARFAKPEALIIRDLVDQVAELVAGPDGDAAGVPRDQESPAGGGREDAAGRDGAGGVRVPAADELAAMVGFSESTKPPEDPILARLLPDGYTDDPDAAQDFRRFTESGLRSAKVAAARTVLDTMPPDGGRVRLSREQAEAWLRALNDVRLALGVRLGVTDDFDGLNDDVSPADPRYAHVQVYQWLAYIQESLLRAL